jgi:hypothetical protein
MKTYRQILEIDKAFERLLHSYRGRNLIRIAYYQSNSKNEYSFVGHKTEDGGFYGIHYNKGTFNFEFGTRGGDNPWVHGLTYPQQNKIPGFLKDALKEVVGTKQVKFVNAPKRPPQNDLNEWK